MYEFIIISLVVAGLAASTFFVFSWTPMAIRATRRGGKVSKFAVLDFALLPFLAFLTLLLSLLSVLVGGVPPASGGIAVTRVLSTGLITVTAIIRAIRWYITIKTTPAGTATGVSSVHDEVPGAP